MDELMPSIAAAATGCMLGLMVWYMYLRWKGEL
jgi:hypothetical protein